VRLQLTAFPFRHHPKQSWRPLMGLNHHLRVQSAKQILLGA
jgi:hypothetical protein